jgi:hypothetical protein
LALVGWVLLFGHVTSSQAQVRVVGTLSNFDVLVPPFPRVNDFHIRIWWVPGGPVPQIEHLFQNPLFGPPQVNYGPGYVDIYYPPVPGGGGLVPGTWAHFGVHLRGNPLGRRVRWACWWTWNGEPVFPQPPWRPGRPWQSWVPWGRPPRMIDVIWWWPEPEWDVQRPIWVQRRVIRMPFPLPLEELRRDGPAWLEARRVDPAPVRLEPGQELEFNDSFFDVFAMPGSPETLVLSYEVFEDVGGMPGPAIGLQMNAVQVEREPAVRVRGRVHLMHWLGPPGGYPVTIQLRPVSGGAPETHTATLSPESEFDIETALREPVNVWVKGVHWLAGRVDNYDPLAPGATLTFRLRNGDVNDDNQVNLEDFLILAAGYDAGPGDPAWNEMSDLNGNLRTDLEDFLILASEYDTIGMP